jgi:hypothetical protein
VFLVGVVISFLVSEVSRSVIHRRRLRRDGLGGTNDVVMWSALAMFACLVAAAVSEFISFLVH